MHCIYFSWFVFDEFIAKGGRECAQSGRTLLLNRWLREVCGKHDKFYLRGELALRKLGGVLRNLGGVLSFSLPFHLSFAAFLPILEFCSALLDDHF
jgi:hypothetical protein